MGLSCGMSMVKYGLFIFNLVCAVAGIALIVVGTIPLFKLDDIREAFPENNPAVVPILTLVLGAVIFTISFFGCCGAIRESQFMVTTYAFFLFVLVIAQIVLAVFAFMYTDELADASRKGFTKLWDQMMQSSDPASTEAINGIQRGLECCGKNGATDWTAALKQVPDSCCADTSNCNLVTAFHTGCGDRLADLVRSSGMLIAYIAIIFGAFELVGVIFACCLANSIRNSTRRQYA